MSSVGFMSPRLLTLAVSLAMLLFAGGSQAAVSQTIYAWFDVDGNLNVRYVDNSNVAGTIPPGTYQFVLNNNTADDYAVDHKFHLFGPGVNYTPPSGAVQTTFSVTFQAGGTYTIQDDLDPAAHRLTVVATTGGAGAGTSSGGSPATGSPPTGSTKPTSSDIVGSEIVPFRGALDAIVYGDGNLALFRNNKRVSTLKAGRYTFFVDDESKTRGFTVQQLGKRAVSITTASFKGTHDLTLALKPGQWLFYSPGAKKSAFTVAS
jgi:hypothetical protein